MLQQQTLYKLPVALVGETGPLQSTNPRMTVLQFSFKTTYTSTLMSEILSNILVISTFFLYIFTIPVQVLLTRL